MTTRGLGPVVVVVVVVVVVGEEGFRYPLPHHSRAGTRLISPETGLVTPYYHHHHHHHPWKGTQNLAKSETTVCILTTMGHKPVW